MKQNVLLIIASVLAVLLFTFHLADDITRGFEKGGPWNMSAFITFGIWLYGALVLSERRSGYIITLVGSLLGLCGPLAHMRGKGLAFHPRIANTPGALFFDWTLIALGVSAFFALVLSVQGLWNLRKRQAS